MSSWTHSEYSSAWSSVWKQPQQMFLVKKYNVCISNSIRSFDMSGGHSHLCRYDIYLVMKEPTKTFLLDALMLSEPYNQDLYDVLPFLGMWIWERFLCAGRLLSSMNLPLKYININKMAWAYHQLFGVKLLGNRPQSPFLEDGKKKINDTSHPMLQHAQ